ncbi:uncharacterized protein [Gorilla gorilla gorilla]|uniref:uncharacterized protein n=1 Tax=Gorilla gorilla gorilla TaxID=9595 RepID=UPI00300A33DF
MARAGVEDKPARRRPASSPGHKGETNLQETRGTESITPQEASPRVGLEEKVGRAQASCSDAVHIKHSRTTQQDENGPVRRRAEPRLARLGTTPPASLKGQGSCSDALARGQNVDGRGNSFPSLSERTAPARRARARSRTTLTLRRAEGFPPGVSRMRGGGSGGEIGCFLLSFSEKFLERWSQRDAGGWGAQGSKRLKESEKPQAHRDTSNLRATAQAEPKATETLTPEKKHRDRGSRSSLCHCSAPETPQHGERAGGSHEKPRALIGRLRGGRKAETRPLEPPVRTGPLEWAQYVRTQRGRQSIGWRRLSLIFPRFSLLSGSVVLSPLVFTLVA